MKSFDKIYQVYLENVNEAGITVDESVYGELFRLHGNLPRDAKTVSGVRIADSVKYVLQDVSEIASELEQIASDVETEQDNPQAIAQLSQMLFDLARRLNSNV